MNEGTKQMELTMRHGKLPHESLQHLKTLHDFSLETHRPEIGQRVSLFSRFLCWQIHITLHRSPEVF